MYNNDKDGDDAPGGSDSDAGKYKWTKTYPDTGEKYRTAVSGPDDDLSPLDNAELLGAVLHGEGGTRYEIFAEIDEYDPRLAGAWIQSNVYVDIEQ